jgi:hypothetical protein
LPRATHPNTSSSRGVSNWLFFECRSTQAAQAAGPKPRRFKRCRNDRTCYTSPLPPVL